MFGLSRKAPAAAAVADGLLEAARGAARAPALFGEGRIPDTVDGRFESMALHVWLLLERLRDEGEEAAAASQALFDAFFRDLDSAVRELGASDLAVAKKIRRMGEAFYGRSIAYREGLSAETDELLEAALARNVFATSPPSLTFLSALADYVRSCHRLQRAQATAALLGGDRPAWAKLPS